MVDDAVNLEPVPSLEELLTPLHPVPEQAAIEQDAVEERLATDVDVAVAPASEQAPLKRFKVFVRHSPLDNPNLEVEAMDKADALKRIRANYPTVQDVIVTEVAQGEVAK